VPRDLARRHVAGHRGVEQARPIEVDAESLRDRARSCASRRYVQRQRDGPARCFPAPASGVRAKCGSTGLIAAPVALQRQRAIRRRGRSAAAGSSPAPLPRRLRTCRYALPCRRCIRRRARNARAAPAGWIGCRWGRTARHRSRGHRPAVPAAH
jgi:hypothetical protein